MSDFQAKTASCNGISESVEHNLAAVKRQSSFEFLTAPEPSSEDALTAHYGARVAEVIKAHRLVMSCPDLVEELIVNFPDCPPRISSWVESLLSSESALHAFFRGEEEE